MKRRMSMWRASLLLVNKGEGGHRTSGCSEG